MIKDIDKKTYDLNESQYYPEKVRKEKIIVGHTYSPDLKFINGWFTREGGKYGKVPHFTISKEGKIYQHVDPSFYCDFLQKKMIDKESISILLVNEGWLQKDGSVYLDWANREYQGSEEDIISRKWRDKQYWAPYEEEQILSLNDLCLYLTNKFGIERNIMDHNVFDKDVVSFKGITFRSNFLKHYTDISPAFNIDDFKNFFGDRRK